MQKFGYHDICATVFMSTDCDGNYDPLQGYSAYCGTSSVAFRKTVNEATEQESANPSSSTGKKCLYRRVEPTPGDCFIDLITCGIEDPALWFKLGMEAPIVHPDTDQIIGFEDPDESVVGCVSCGKESATCRHKFAFMTIHNKWCGDDQRATDAPYVARIHPSLDLEVVEETENFAAGFTQFRTISAKINRNPFFVDPFGIDPRTDPTQRSNSKKRVLNVQCPEGSPVDQLMNSACNCGVCDGELTIAEANPNPFDPAAENSILAAA